MLNVLFWNLNRKDLGSALADIAKETSAQIVVATESGSPPEQTLRRLQSHASAAFYLPDEMAGRFQVFCNDESLRLDYVSDWDRLQLRRVHYRGEAHFLALIHAVDARNHDSDERRFQAQVLSTQIAKFELAEKHQRTFVIGDFNMNPFDKGMVRRDGFNAQMTKDCALRAERANGGNPGRAFYNPMWGLFGDRTEGPAGTFFHRSRTRDSHGWNMLDQVLVRPEVMHRLADVRILTTSGTESLATTNGLPGKKRFSDHFPILLTIGGS